MMLFAALGSLAMAPLLNAAAARAAARGGSASGGMVALDGWMAVVASGVVLLEVMPEGMERLGALSIAIALLGAALTSAAHHGGGDRWVGGAALLGLAAHSMLDGVAITGATGAAAFGAGLAVTLHNAPAGVAIWRTAGRYAPRALGVALAATALGGLLGKLGYVAGHGDAFTPLLTGVQCFVAGSVLHIATHASHNAPASTPRRAVFSALGAIAGVLTVGGISLAHPAEAPFATELPAVSTALALWIEGAPWIFGGLIVTFLLGPWLPRSRANLVVGVFAAGAWLGPGVAAVQVACLVPVLLLDTPVLSPGRRDVVADTAPWLLAGLVGASLAEPWLAQELDAIPLGVQLLSAAFLHLLLASPVALAPIAALLIHKGADPSVALALTLPALLLPLLDRCKVPAPALHLCSVSGGIAVAAASLLLHVQAPGVVQVPDLHDTVAHAHGVIEYTCAATVAGLYLAALLRSGLYGFVHTLESAPD